MERVAYRLQAVAAAALGNRVGAIAARPYGRARSRLHQFVRSSHSSIAHVASTFDATAVRVDTQRIDALIMIYRGPMPAIELLYSILWDEQQASDELI